MRADDLEQKWLRIHWPYLMWPLCEMLGCAFVWDLGLKALGYPPTWVDTKWEVDQIELQWSLFNDGSDS